MIFPVGVGFRSLGPTGVEGLTMVSGNPFSRKDSAARSARNLLFL